MAKLLLVEDEKKLHTLIKHALENAGYQVFSAFDGRSAKDAIEGMFFDAAILDVMLPDMDGWQLLKAAQTKNIPAIMTTARALEEDKLFGFELGAEDYLTKPFSLNELIARIKVLLKRHQPKLDIKGPIIMDPSARTCEVHQTPVHLSVIEFDLLHAFISHPNQALSRDQLLNLVWGYDYYGDARTVDTHVKRLRQKLAPLDAIHTVRGIGYKFEVKDV